jgi:hypothetical protein
LVQAGVCLTSGTSRFDGQGRPGNHDSRQKYDKIANLSGSATRSQEKICLQHPLNTSLDLYVGLRSVDAVWDVNVWVKNIADESAKLKDRSLPAIPDYANAIMIPSPYVEIRSQLPPRTFGITLSYNFGR